MYAVSVGNPESVVMPKVCDVEAAYVQACHGEDNVAVLARPDDGTVAMDYYLSLAWDQGFDVPTALAAPFMALVFNTAEEAICVARHMPDGMVSVYAQGERINMDW